MYWANCGKMGGRGGGGVGGSAEGITLKQASHTKRLGEYNPI